METATPTKSLTDLIQELLRKSEGEINAYITEVDTHLEVGGTKALSHCYFVTLDGNGRPRDKDFARFVARHVVDYAIPRKEIEEAKKYDDEHSTTTAMAKLIEKAKGLFTTITTSGEGGEMLLYVLVQEFLKLPQLICKMPLKTNPEVHYHGADGIHVSVEKNVSGQNMLSLYWGESKLYQSVDDAVRECIKSLKEFILSDGSSGTPSERDLQLLQDNINVADKDLEDALVNYLDKDHPLYNRVNYKGVCLIGFDSDKYPSLPNTETTEQIKTKIEAEISDWSKKVSGHIEKYAGLNSFEIHVFLIPFPSVEQFRLSFATALGLAYDPVT